MENDVKAEVTPKARDEAGFIMTRKGDVISFERETQKQTRTVIYEPAKCTGCGLCYEACPMNAIELGPVGAVTTHQLEGTQITIDPHKCVLCGICSEVCMFGTIDMRINGESIKNSSDYLKYARVFEFYQDKCKMKDEEKGVMCKDCEEVCPREAIEAKLIEKNGKTINSIDHFSDKCIYCSTCARACPQDAIIVKKAFEGKTEVDLDKCQGCGVCYEVCPSKAISMPKPSVPGEKVDKIVIDNEVCIFCSACEKACPVDAITVNRTEVHYVKRKEKSWIKRWEEAFNKLKKVKEEGISDV